MDPKILSLPLCQSRIACSKFVKHFRCHDFHVIWNRFVKCNLFIDRVQLIDCHVFVSSNRRHKTLSKRYDTYHNQKGGVNTSFMRIYQIAVVMLSAVRRQVSCDEIMQQFAATLEEEMTLMPSCTTKLRECPRHRRRGQLVNFTAISSASSIHCRWSALWWSFKPSLFAISKCSSTAWHILRLSICCIFGCCHYDVVYAGQISNTLVPRRATNRRQLCGRENNSSRAADRPFLLCQIISRKNIMIEWVISLDGSVVVSCVWHAGVGWHATRMAWCDSYMWCM